MRKMQREQTFNARVSFTGIGYVFVCIAAFLFLAALIVVAVRFIVG